MCPALTRSLLLLLRCVGTQPLLSLQIVSPKELMLAQLAEYDGSDPSKPILLSIRGTLYDVTPGGLGWDWGWGGVGCNELGMQLCWPWSRQLASCCSSMSSRGAELIG